MPNLISLVVSSDADPFAIYYTAHSEALGLSDQRSSGVMVLTESLSYSWQGWRLRSNNTFTMNSFWCIVL